MIMDLMVLIFPHHVYHIAKVISHTPMDGINGWIYIYADLFPS